MVFEDGHIHATAYDDHGVADEQFEGYERVDVYDPFGNRIEVMEPNASPH